MGATKQSAAKREREEDGTFITNEVAAYGNTQVTDKKRRLHKKAIIRAEMYVASRLPFYLALLEELAEGVTLSETKIKGDEEIVKIYKTKPDRQALQFLIERGMGKTPQKIELTGDQGTKDQYSPWVAGTEADFEEGEFKPVVEALPNGKTEDS